jgi:hypothetical protein
MAEAWNERTSSSIRRMNFGNLPKRETVISDISTAKLSYSSVPEESNEPVEYVIVVTNESERSLCDGKSKNISHAGGLTVSASVSVNRILFLYREGTAQKADA